MKYNIVLTDCNTVNAGDLDLRMLEEFGNVTYYGETAPSQVSERIKDADIIILNKTVIGKAEIDAAPNLKMIALWATGYNNIDVAYARERGIDVCNAGSYSTGAVAQQVFAYILAHASRVTEYDADVKNGDWIRSRLFCFFSRPTQELEGKTLGIFGFGAIDVIFGTIATFLSALLTYLSGKKIKNKALKFVVGAFFPVIINAIIVPLIFIMTGSADQVYIINFLTVFAGQFLSVYVVGGYLYFALKKFRH